MGVTISRNRFADLTPRSGDRGLAGRGLLQWGTLRVQRLIDVRRFEGNARNGAIQSVEARILAVAAERLVQHQCRPAAIFSHESARAAASLALEDAVPMRMPTPLAKPYDHGRKTPQI